MTFADLAARLDIELDKANAPWQNDTEKSHFLEAAYQKLIDDFAEKAEVDEQSRRALQALLVDSAPQSTASFNLTLITDLYRIQHVRGTFAITCNGKTENVSRKISPVQNDDVDEEDVFSRGINEDPNYEEVNQRLIINSDSAPTSVIVRYIKQHVPIDVETLPGNSPEIHINEHIKIVYFARDAILDNIESSRYQTAKNETAEQNL